MAHTQSLLWVLIISAHTALCVHTCVGEAEDGGGRGEKVPPAGARRLGLGAGGGQRALAWRRQSGCQHRRSLQASHAALRAPRLHHWQVRACTWALSVSHTEAHECMTVLVPVCWVKWFINGFHDRDPACSSFTLIQRTTTTSLTFLHTGLGRRQAALGAQVRVGRLHAVCEREARQRQPPISHQVRQPQLLPALQAPANSPNERFGED